MKIKLYFIPIFCLLSMPILGQSTKIDSLQGVLATAKDTLKVKTLLALSRATSGSSPEKAIHYAEQALQLAGRYDYRAGEALALKNIGLVYYTQGNYGEVLKYWQRSLRVFEAIQDKTGIGNMLNNIGAIYFNEGSYATALDYYLKSLKLGEQLGDKLRIATAMTNIGALYFAQAKNEKALGYYQSALKISREINNLPAMGTAMVNMGEVYMSQGDDASALKYFSESLSTLTETSNTSAVAYSLNNIGKLYAKKKEYTKALDYQHRAYNTASAVDAKLEMAQSLIGLGSTYDKQQKPALSLESFQKAQALATEIGSNNELKEAYLGMAKSYAQLSDYQKAFLYQTKLTAIKDSLFSTEGNRKMADLQTQYENEKKQAQIDLLTKDGEIQQLEIQQQKVIRNALLSGLAIILLLVFVLFRSFQMRTKALKLLSKQNEEIRNQKEEISSQRDHLEQTFNQLKNAQSQLIQSEKMASLGQLTAGVAHEINNPINFVSAGIDSIQTNFQEIIGLAKEYFSLMPGENLVSSLKQLHIRRKASEVDELVTESEQLFRSVKNGAKRTTQIVKILRNFTRLDEGYLKQADIHEGLDSTLLILENQLEMRIEVVKNYASIEAITCYPGQLNQVFFNILTNAIQAIKGSGKIFIETSQENEQALIRIRDTGAGMTEDVRKHIFEPFFTTKKVGEGTGLGLAISYSIIEKHHGKIEVESEPGQGTTFVIRLPIKLTERVPVAVEGVAS